MELDHTLTSRDTINAKIRGILDEATDPWGIKVNRVELKNIVPPAEIQDAMEKQMKAERQRRESILRAEGERPARSWLPRPEGKPDSRRRRREAGRNPARGGREEAKIREAEGQAQAILAVQKAEAEGIRMINEAAPGEGVITIKSLEAFQKVADGQATKIIIPSDIQGPCRPCNQRGRAAAQGIGALLKKR